MTDIKSVKQKVIADTRSLQKTFERYESAPELLQIEKLENAKKDLKTMLEFADHNQQQIIEQKMSAIEQEICTKVQELKQRRCCL